MFCSSSGARRLRSTTFSPPTATHSSAAMPTAMALSPKLPEGVVGHQSNAPPWARSATALRSGTSVFRRARRRSASSPRSTLPSSASEMRPVSSDTTMVAASVSSVRPMAARCRVPKSLLIAGLTRQRQEARGGRDPVALDDHRAVVQRRPRLEDAQQQVVGQRGVERNAALDVVAQADVALDGDDRARPLARQHRRRHDQFLDDLVVRLGAREVAEEARAAQVRQRPADFVLEEHDRREDDVPEHVPDEPVHRVEVPPPRQVEHGDEQAHTDAHLHRPRAAHELEQLIDRDGRDDDVQDVGPRDRRTLEEGSQGVHVSVRSTRSGKRTRRIAASAPLLRARPPPDGVGHAHDLHHGRDRVHAHDVRAEQHRRRHGRRRGPVAVRRRHAAQSRSSGTTCATARRAAADRAPAGAAAPPARRSCARPAWRSRCPGRARSARARRRRAIARAIASPSSAATSATTSA